MADIYKDGARVYADVAAEAQRIQQRVAHFALQSKRQNEAAQRDNELRKPVAGSRRG